MMLYVGSLIAMRFITGLIGSASPICDFTVWQGKVLAAGLIIDISAVKLNFEHTALRFGIYSA
jgi:hypothetical protein